MQKKLSALLFYFICFYVLVHLGRHVPHLLDGKFHIGGETTWLASFVRTATDMSVSFLFVLLSYLCLWYYYPKKKIGAIFLIMPLCLIATLTAGYAVTSAFENQHVPVGGYFSMSLFTNTVDLIFGIVFFFLQYGRYRELREAELQTLARQSELSFLRAQVNPHFLFNQLNTIYALISEGSQQALDAVSGLSGLLRYMLYDIDKPVPLAVEIEHIRQLIALQQFKYEHPVPVGFELTGNIDRVMMQPLLLLPFVENAFKHGRVSHQAGTISIELNADKTTVQFRCTNAKSDGQKDPEGGIGIENVRRRLDLLYADNYVLKISDTMDKYMVELEFRYAS